jgi:L-fuconolactonase
VRHQQAEDRGPEYFLQPEVLRGFAAVERSGLVYDFLCRAPQLPTAAAVARRFPGLKLVLEHAGKPPIATGELSTWAAALEPLHETPNVACKLSELTTQADWSSWRPADLAPCVAHAVNVFGYERLMWGSGWPICLLASSYERTLTATRELLPSAGPDQLRQVFRHSAVSWYGLDLS